MAGDDGIPRNRDDAGDLGAVNMANDCRPRGTRPPPITRDGILHDARVKGSIDPGNPTYLLPDNHTPLDLVINDLRTRKQDDEIIVNAMKLLSESSEAKGVADRIRQEMITAMNPPETTRELIVKLTYCLELLMAIGFLTGTAVGFAAGLQFEPSDDDDDEDYPPDYDDPMI